MTPETDTIYALATAPGRAGVAVMRVSGPRAGAVLEQLTGARGAPRAARLADISGDEGLIDRGLTLWFPAPGSFTGEDVAEFHVHGGASVIAALGGAFEAANLRQAAPGEFTRRAFEHGKMDLTEAEGLADLVDAETDAQRSQALRQMAGALKEIYSGWRERLLAVTAQVEAEIDFPDEGDVPDALARRAGPELDALMQALQGHLEDAHRGERVRDGFRIALIGPPNAGKSSLLNRLSRREAAIVTEIPGTTRDVVEVHLDLGGYPVIIADTAGLRETADRIEAEGVKRALARAEDADLRIGVADASDPDSAAALTPRLRPQDLLVWNKCDVAGSELPGEGISISALTGDGLEALENRLTGIVIEALGRSGAPSLTRQRHRSGVLRALEALQRGRLRLSDAPELAGEDLRLAARAMAEITGHVDVEDVLGEIFGRFCIGK